MKRNSCFKDRTGEIGRNKFGTKMMIVEYRTANDITVGFENGYKVKTIRRNFLAGEVRNPYDKSVHGVGYLGEGKYYPRESFGKLTHCYSVWSGVIARCYSPILQKNSSAYHGVTVATEWHNFQNFGLWYDKNFYSVPGEKMELDKDIFSTKGGKIYSPETCIFVPSSINRFFVRDVKAKTGLPTGVIHSENKLKFISQCQNGKKKFAKTFGTPEEAFLFYKVNKESVAKEFAVKYKGLIPDKVYQALLNYKVEIGD